MNLENISKNFIYTVVVYIFVLLYGVNFILTNLRFGGLTADFWLIVLIILLPVIPAILYSLRTRSGFLFVHSKLLLKLTMIFIFISTIFVVVFLIPLSY